MKRLNRFLCFVLLAVTVLSLAACGSKKTPDNQPDATTSGVASSGQAGEPSEAQVPAVTEAPSSKNPPTSIEAGVPADAHAATPEELKAIAEAFIDRDVSELFEAIGEPVDSSYESSCLGPGQDGELVYDGFTVYTYKEGDSEVVRVVL